MIGAAHYYVQVRVKIGGGTIRLNRNRWVREHGIHGRLNMVRADQALDLVDRGLVKLRPGMSLQRLRDEVASKEGGAHVHTLRCSAQGGASCDRLWLTRPTWSSC